MLSANWLLSSGEFNVYDLIYNIILCLIKMIRAYVGVNDNFLQTDNKNYINQGLQFWS